MMFKLERHSFQPYLAIFLLIYSPTHSESVSIADNLEATSHRALARFESGDSFRGKKNSDVPAPEILVLGLFLQILV